MVTEYIKPQKAQEYHNSAHVPMNKVIRYFITDTVQSMHTIDTTLCEDGTSVYVVADKTIYYLYNKKWYPVGKQSKLEKDLNIGGGTAGATDYFYVNSGVENKFTNTNDIFYTKDNPTGGTSKWLDLRSMARTYYLEYDILSALGMHDGETGLSVSLDTTTIVTNVPFNKPRMQINANNRNLYYTVTQDSENPGIGYEFTDPVYPSQPIPIEEVSQPAIIYVIKPHYSSDKRLVEHTVTGILKNTTIITEGDNHTLIGDWTLLDMGLVPTDNVNITSYNLGSGDWMLGSFKGFYQLSRKQDNYEWIKRNVITFPYDVSASTPQFTEANTHSTFSAEILKWEASHTLNLIHINVTLGNTNIATNPEEIWSWDISNGQIVFNLPIKTKPFDNYVEYFPLNMTWETPYENILFGEDITTLYKDYGKSRMTRMSDYGIQFDFLFWTDRVFFKSITPYARLGLSATFMIPASAIYQD